MDTSPAHQHLASSVAVVAPHGNLPPDWAVAMASPQETAAFSVSRHTEQPLEEPHLAHLSMPACPESPNDAFAAVFGTAIGRASDEELKSLGDILEHLRDVSSLPSALGSRLDAESEPKIEMLLGPLVEAEDGVRATWIEVNNVATGESICPDIPWLIDKLPPTVFQKRDVPPCERFHGGTVRLLVELGPHGSGDLVVIPWVSPECQEEALSHFILSVRTAGSLGPSYLHSAVLSALCSELAEDDIIPETASLSKLYEEVGLSLASLSQSSDGEVSFELHFTGAGDISASLLASGFAGFSARFGIGDRGDFNLLDIILHRLSPWLNQPEGPSSS